MISIYVICNVFDDCGCVNGCIGILFNMVKDILYFGCVGYGNSSKCRLWECGGFVWSVNGCFSRSIIVYLWGGE